MKKTIKHTSFLLGLSFLFQLLTVGVVNAQETKAESDTSKKSLKSVLEDGVIHINLRDFSMGTVYDPKFINSWVNAFSGRMDFHSGEWKGFSFGLGGSFIMNVASSDLGAVEPLTGRKTVFERQLLDVQNTDNKDIGGVEELFIQYHFNKTIITAGRFHIKTPLVNLHDGRMRPNSISGLWVNMNEIKKVHLGIGWFIGSSPRSTNVWEDMAGTIGIFGTGLNEDGTPSGYRNNLSTSGLGVFKGIYKPNSNLKFAVWNYFIENIVNTAMLQVSYKRKHFYAGVQYIHQDGMGNGGSDIAGNRYVQPDHKADLISERIGYKNKVLSLELSHAWALPTGRFVFPRELGYDKIFANIPRNRIEGFGDTHMATFKSKVSPKKWKGFSIDNHFTAILHDNTNNPKYNKLNFSQTGQTNVLANYNFQGFLDGLSATFLYTYSFALEYISEQPKLEYARTNFHHFNLILNYRLTLKKEHKHQHKHHNNH